MYSCASCTIYACGEPRPEKLPTNCPMRKTELMNTAFQTYSEPDNKTFYITASELEAAGYCQWPRLKETIELCRRMGYRRVGLAFCRGLRNEAKIVASVLRNAGLEVVSVICKTGGVDKELCGIPEAGKNHPAFVLYK